MEGEFQVKVAKTEEELEKYYNLRHKVLFEPWNQPVTAGRDTLEDVSIHKMIVDSKGDVVAVGKLHFIEAEKQAQVKYLAVDESYQKRGFGTMLLLDMEKTALEGGTEVMTLNARLNSVPFYEKHGYKYVKDTPYTLCNGAIKLKTYNKRLGKDDK